MFLRENDFENRSFMELLQEKCHMKRQNAKKNFVKIYRKVRRQGKALFLAAVLTAAGGVTGVWSLPVLASDEEVEEAKERVAQAEEKAKDLQDAKTRFAGYLDELNGQLDVLTTELSELSARQTELQARLEVTAKELLAAKETEADQYEAMKKRIQYMYENGDTGFIELVFSAESLSSILNRAEYAMELAEYDRNMLAAYQETRELVAKKEEDLLTDQAELDQVIAQTQGKQSQVLLAVAETSEKMEACAEELEDAQGELSQYRRELQQKELEAEARMAKLAEEARRREEEEREQQVADGLGSNAAAPGAKPSGPSGGSAEEPSGNPGTNETPGQEPPSENPPSADQTPSDPTPAPQPSEPEEPAEFDYSVYSDVELLAAMIYREANMEPWEGKVAVGNVVMNRIASGLYPNTMIGVLSQPYQFSPWDGPKYRKLLQNGVGGDCRRAAEVAMSGSENHIGGLLHFRTIKPGYEGIVIGGHVFY